MPRSVYKGPYVSFSLLKKIEKSKANKGDKKIIKTFSRTSAVIPQFVGQTLAVHNGKSFIPVYITENMIGHKLGEFSPTRVFKGHAAADKKADAGNKGKEGKKK